MREKRIELLAPGRNYNSGKIAVDNGADAVYIAGPQFGAREAAGNSLTDVERLVAYAHQFYANVYLTLNTLLFEHELEAARKLAYDAWNIGCDALIIQDMGLLETDLPPIPLFASTQTNNVSSEKVKFLQDTGFSRVILARELSLKQITAIRQSTTVDLECFIHGALCVCYSGQCYLSQALTGRSANRGICAQPCRAQYDLLDADGNVIIRNKHLLSLRDLCLHDYLPVLLDAGITSFKIEGRLKNESYVKNTVAYYRTEIDRLLDGKSCRKTSSGTAVHTFTPDVERSFSRQFTDYFINDRREEIFSHDTGKAIGQKVGKIITAGTNWFTYEGKPLHNADGICFFDRHGRLFGTNVNRVEKEKIIVRNGNGLTSGAIVYRNYDFVFERSLQHSGRRAIAADLSFVANTRQITITAKDEDGVTATLIFPQCGAIAQNETAALTAIKTQLEKSGASLFNFTVNRVNCTPVYFYPLSQLNNWRKRLTALLIKEREIHRKRIFTPHFSNAIPYPETEIDYRGNAANSLARQFYKRHGVTAIASAFEETAPKKAELMRTKYCLKQAIGTCKKHSAKEMVIKEPLYLLNNGKKLRLIFDCKNCQMIISQ